MPESQFTKAEMRDFARRLFGVDSKPGTTAGTDVSDAEDAPLRDFTIDLFGRVSS